MDVDRGVIKQEQSACLELISASEGPFLTASSLAFRLTMMEFRDRESPIVTKVMRKRNDAMPPACH